MAGFSALGLGLLALIGWATGVLALTGRTGSSVPLVAESASLLVPLALVLALGLTESRRGFLTLLLFAASLAASVYGFSRGLRLFVGPLLDGGFLVPIGSLPGPQFYSRMSPYTGLFFGGSWAAICLSILASRWPRLRAGSGALGFLCLTMGFLGLLAWAFGAPVLFQDQYTPISLSAVLAYIAVGAALIADAGPRFPILRPLIGGGPSAIFLRATLPVVAGSILAIGFIQQRLLPPSGAQRGFAQIVLTCAMLAFSATAISFVARRSFRRADGAEEARRAAAEKLGWNLADSTLLNRSLEGLLGAKTIEEVYVLVGEATGRLAPGAYVFISGLAEDERFLRLYWIDGLASLRGAIRGLLGYDLWDWRGPLAAITPEEFAVYRDGKVHEMEDGLWALALRSIPRPICASLTALAGVRAIHFVGFAWDQLHYGGIMVALRGGGAFRGKEALEHLARQASTAIRRLRAEEALRRQTERWQQTFDAIQDQVFVTSPDLVILHANRATSMALGVEPASLLGKRCSELYHESGEPTPDCPCTRARETCLHEAREIRERGRIYEESIWPILDAAGRPSSFVHTVADLTERRAAEEALATQRRRIEENLQRSQKLESLGLLAGGIAHDFNNLLHGVFNLVELAKLKLARGEAQKAGEFLEATKPVYGRARALAQQFLTFSKGGAPVRRTIPIEPLLRHCAEFSLAGSKSTARVAIDGALWLCDADEQQLGHAIDNLLINARQAMPQGGSIEASARNVEIQPPSGGALGRFVRISVRDGGCGIPDENLPRIFDPFFTTKEKGQGLGLTMVHSILKAHGGWVEVESGPGKGSAFHCFLPASGAQAPPEPFPARGAERLCGAACRVLVLDDQEYARRVAREFLEEQGFRVGEADHGQAAVERIYEGLAAGDPYRIAILDLTIPGGMGGREAAKAMGAADPALYLVAASGYSNDPVMAAPAEHGFHAALSKPYLADELLGLMRRAGAGVR
ncbi:MAG: response regulator [Spirochaetes bacterium]|nr:response regulator [Spirochaetota bacterium]